MSKFQLPLICFISLLASIPVCLHSQILIDEEYDDWNTQNLMYTDANNDALSTNIDFGKIWIDHSQEYLFLSVELNKETIIQENNNLQLHIDLDQSSNTGTSIGGIGADLSYRFGDRRGNAFVDGFNWTIFHTDIGLVTSPTVSTERFDIAIRRENDISGRTLNIDGGISVLLVDDRFDGDQIPSESGGIDYSLSEVGETELPGYSIKKPVNSDLRILSYNVLRDGPFENQRDEAFGRILRAVEPDVIAFQEIYNHNSAQTRDFVVESLGSNETWYHSSLFSDNILVSKYPILKTESIDGNTAFLVDIDGKEMLIISAHLPCCGNNISRQQEVDNIMSFVRRSKAKQTFIPLEEDTPIIICGDMNFVGFRKQVETLITGNIDNNNAFGPDFFPDWDDSNFEDAKPFTTGLPLTFTWYSDNESFSPGRLDYVIYSGSVMQEINSYSLFTENLPQDSLSEYQLNDYDVLLASDHMPLVVDFSFDVSSSSFSLNNINFPKLSPSPAESTSTLTFELPVFMNIQIDIVNQNGQIFNLMPEQGFPAGPQEISLDFSDFRSGIYYLLISSAKNKETLQVVIMK